TRCSRRPGAWAWRGRTSRRCSTRWPGWPASTVRRRRGAAEMGLRTYGVMGVDTEQRVDFDRLRRDRLRRVRRALAGSEPGAVLCFDFANIRYITSTHIGTWGIDKLIRFCLLPPGAGAAGEPILWDCRSAARPPHPYS